MKYKILFVCALPLELKVIKNIVNSLNIKSLDIKFLLSGVWNYNTIYNLKDYLLKNNKQDFLINIGVCGSIFTVISEYLQIYRIKNLSDSKEKLCPIYFRFWNNLESIASSEKIITDKKDLLWENFVDMESYWIDFICSKEKIPYSIFKIPFDEISSNSKKVSISELEESLKKFPYEDLLLSLEKYLKNQKKVREVDLSFYKEYFKFTFSEFEIFKKKYNKFIAFQKNFLDFFEQNKNLPKKDFLSKFDC